MKTPDYLGDDGPIYKSNNGTGSPAFPETEMQEMTYGPQALAFQAEQAAWKRRAPDLAAWVMKTMVVRSNAYGKYAIDRQGHSKKWKEDGQVDQRLLERHFSEDSAQIGLYTTDVDDRCRWLAIDVDRHDGHTSKVRDDNRRYVFHVYKRL